MLQCALVGCKSTYKDHKIKFIKFPSPQSSRYMLWLKKCSSSANLIKMHPDPYICSRHFQNERGVKLTSNSVPSLHLDPVRDVINKCNAVFALINNAVFVWSLRAHHYPDTAPVCKLKSRLSAIAQKIRNMLNSSYPVEFEDSWWKRFSDVHLGQITKDHLRSSANKTLNLEEILRELDPNFVTYDDEIVVVSDAKYELMELAGTNNDDKNTDQMGGSPSEGNSSATEVLLTKERNIGDLNLQSVVPMEVSNESDNRSVGDVKPELMVATGEYFKTPECSRDALEEGSENINMDLKEQRHKVEAEASFGSESKLRLKSDLVIDSNKDALKYINVLEEFALQREDYKALGMISSLKYVLQDSAD